MANVLVPAPLQENFLISRKVSVKIVMMIVNNVLVQVHFNVQHVEQDQINYWLKILTVILLALLVQLIMGQGLAKIVSILAKHVVIKQKSNVLLVRKISFLIMWAHPIPNALRTVPQPKQKIL